MPEAVRRQQISKNMEGLTIADVMALQRRDYGYGDGYCYHRGGRGMAATGIGLGAGGGSRFVAEWWRKQGRTSMSYARCALSTRNAVRLQHLC